MNVHTVALPDGKVATRESLTRRYGFVVIAECHVYGFDTWEWDALAWSASERNAEAVAAKKRQYPGYYRDVRVAVASMVERTPKPRRMAASSERPCNCQACLTGDGH